MNTPRGNMPSAPAREGLTAQASSEICMRQCHAGCCRGPLILSLSGPEALALTERAAALGVGLRISPAPGGGGWLRFSDHPGQRCPMLDSATCGCRIYEDRPQRCRDFPEKPTPGCAISGAGVEKK